MASKKPVKPVRVRVADHTQVWHDGNLYRAGEELEAPPVDADSWIANGWAVELSPRERPKAEPSRLLPHDGGFPTPTEPGTAVPKE
jgi:hypothetical protein